MRQWLSQQGPFQKWREPIYHRYVIYTSLMWVIIAKQHAVEKEKHEPYKVRSPYSLAQNTGLKGFLCPMPIKALILHKGLFLLRISYKLYYKLPCFCPPSSANNSQLKIFHSTWAGRWSKQSKFTVYLGIGASGKLQALLSLSCWWNSYSCYSCRYIHLYILFCLH